MLDSPKHEIVTFPYPVKGSLLIDVVKRVIIEDLTDPSARFIHQDNNVLGPVFRIGQWSEYSHNHLIITPTAERAGVRPEVLYDRVTVSYRFWGGTVSATAQNTLALQERSVRQLASKLKAYFWNSSDTEPVWPQEVEVCVVCERPLQLQDGQMQCLRHGADYPTKTIKVVPYSE